MTTNKDILEVLSKVVEKLADGQMSIQDQLSALKDIAAAAINPNAKAPESAADPWKDAVCAAMGKTFPDKIPYPFSSASLLDPTICCDPFLLILVMNISKEKDWVENTICSGELLRRWRSLVLRDAVWLPSKASQQDSAFLIQNVTRLENTLLTLAISFYRNPKTILPATFLLEQQHTIQSCLDLAKEIEGRNIKLRSGNTAANEFFSSYRIMSRKAGASFMPSIAKIRVRGHDKDKQNPDSDDSDNDRHDRRGRGGRGGRGGNRGGRDGRGGKVNVDPTPAAPRRCNRCQKEVTTTWAIHQAASPTCK